MTSLTGTPAALTAYLRRATWGLPKARQQELWDELEDHVLTRVDHLCALGIGPEEALAQALRELGPPTRVSAGMTQVYLMPKVLLTAGAVALALSAALYALAGGSEGNVIRLPVLTRPSPTAVCTPLNDINLNLPIISQENGRVCYRVSDTFKGDGALVSVSAINLAVRALGGTVSVLPDGRIQIRMPDGTWTQAQPAFRAGGESYLFASSFFGSLIQLRPHTPGSEVSISGYRDPVLRIGGRTIQFTAASDPRIGRSLYGELGSEVVNALFYPGVEEARTLTFQYGSGASPRHRVQTQLRAGEVVTLVQRLGANEFFISSGEVQAGGVVELQASSPQLKFVETSALMTQGEGGSRTPTLLVRVTNVPLRNLKSGIFLPAQPTSDAR